MVDLTDDELGWQGLNAESFGKLDDEARDFVVKRALFYRDVKNRTLVAELLNRMASEVKDKRTIVDVLEGKNRRGVEAVRLIVEEFKKSGMQDIKDYYTRFYFGKADIILTGFKEQPEEPPTQEKVTPENPAVQTKPEAKGEDIEGIIPPSPKKGLKPSREDRVNYIASAVSRWTSTPVEKVVRLDKDLIDKIMSFTDSNSDKGLKDYEVCKACENMLQDKKKLGIHFPLELLTTHKDELLNTALSLRRI